MKTLHMIGNAHMDPAWLWERFDGMDATLATARSACDRLDEYPEFVFTCSASWFHHVVELCDPDLFERVRQAVSAGRWQLVGGMVVQPDCNLPNAESFAWQLTLGQDYFRRTFGQTATIGYNVDTFGHTGYLPRFLREAGIDSYVFMRPGPGENARLHTLFRWRSPDGHEVTTFRIPGAYCTHGQDHRGHIERTIQAAPPGLDHMMCFYGVGDHGGGPTKAQLDWLLANADAFEGWRIVLSHPRAFFDAVADRLDTLPIWTGELQHHAIGCYAVERRIKVSMRRAETRLHMARQVADVLPEQAPAELDTVLAEGWGTVAFNEFHDIMGGTCIDRVNVQASSDMFNVESRCDELITRMTRRASRRHAEPGVEKIVLLNPTDEDFEGHIDHRPWFVAQYGGATPVVRVLDEQGREVPSQVLLPQAKTQHSHGLLVRSVVPARSMRVLRIERPAKDTPAPSAESGGFDVRPGSLRCGDVRIDLTRAGFALAGWDFELAVYDDPTDTWSHEPVNQFKGERIGRFEWLGQWEPFEAGPLSVSLRRKAGFGDSWLWAELTLRAGEPFARLHLRVVWSQVRQRLAVRVTTPGTLARRMDLISGGPQERAMDGLEYPLVGGLAVETDAGGSLGLIGPEVFSVNARPGEIQLTLVRSPYMAHHVPVLAADRPEKPVTDLGRHEIALRLWPGGPLDADALARHARDMQAGPILSWNVTG